MIGNMVSKVICITMILDNKFNGVLVSKSKKPQVYPKENEDKTKETIQKLKNRIRKLEKDNRNLVSENKTLQKSFEQSIERIKTLTESKDLNDIIKEEKKKTLQKKGKEVTQEDLSKREETRRKFAEIYGRRPINESDTE